MEQKTVRFNFQPEHDAEAVEDDFGLALLIATYLHGEPAVRLAVRYLVSSTGHACVAQTVGDVGETVLKVFTGLCVARVGAEGFEIKHL